MEFWKKHGRKAFAKHLRNKKSKRTKRMANNSKSRQDADTLLRKVSKTQFQVLSASLIEVKALKSKGCYHDRDLIPRSTPYEMINNR